MLLVFRRYVLGWRGVRGNRIPFPKAFLSGEKEPVKQYLADPSQIDTFGFQVEGIPGKQYLDMDFRFVDGTWKVTNYYLQA